MPNADLKGLYADPQFQAMTPRDKRLLLGRMLDTDANYQSVPDEQRLGVRNRILNQFPDAEAQPTVSSVPLPGAGMGQHQFGARAYPTPTGNVSADDIAQYRHDWLSGDRPKARPTQLLDAIAKLPASIRAANFPPNTSAVGRAAILEAATGKPRAQTAQERGDLATMQSVGIDPRYSVTNVPPPAPPIFHPTREQQGQEELAQRRSRNDVNDRRIQNGNLYDKLQGYWNLGDRVISSFLTQGGNPASLPNLTSGRDPNAVSAGDEARAKMSFADRVATADPNVLRAAFPSAAHAADVGPTEGLAGLGTGVGRMLMGFGDPSNVQLMAAMGGVGKAAQEARAALEGIQGLAGAGKAVGVAGRLGSMASSGYFAGQLGKGAYQGVQQYRKTGDTAALGEAAGSALFGGLTAKHFLGEVPGLLSDVAGTNIAARNLPVVGRLAQRLNPQPQGPPIGPGPEYFGAKAGDWIKEAYPTAAKVDPLHLNDQHIGYHVTMPSGDQFPILFRDALKAAGKGGVMTKAQFNDQYGRDPTPDDVLNGLFVPEEEASKYKLPGISRAGAILLSKGKEGATLIDQADRRTVIHESFHQMRRLGFIKDHEWDDLLERYAPDATSDADAEEKIARAFENYNPGKEYHPVFQRIINTFRRVADQFKSGGQNYRTDDVFRSLRKGERWGKPAQDAAAEDVAYAKGQLANSHQPQDHLSDDPDKQAQGEYYRNGPGSVTIKSDPGNDLVQPDSTQKATFKSEDDKNQYIQDKADEVQAFATSDNDNFRDAMDFYPEMANTAIDFGTDPRTKTTDIRNVDLAMRGLAHQSPQAQVLSNFSLTARALLSHLFSGTELGHRAKNPSTGAQEAIQELVQNHAEGQPFIDNDLADYLNPKRPRGKAGKDWVPPDKVLKGTAGVGDKVRSFYGNGMAEALVKLHNNPDFTNAQTGKPFNLWNEDGSHGPDMPEGLRRHPDFVNKARLRGNSTNDMWHQAWIGPGANISTEMGYKAGRDAEGNLQPGIDFERTKKGKVVYQDGKPKRLRAISWIDPKSEVTVPIDGEVGKRVFEDISKMKDQKGATNFDELTPLMKAKLKYNPDAKTVSVYTDGGHEGIGVQGVKEYQRTQELTGLITDELNARGGVNYVDKDGTPRNTTTDKGGLDARTLQAIVWGKTKLTHPESQYHDFTSYDKALGELKQEIEDTKGLTMKQIMARKKDVLDPVTGEKLKRADAFPHLGGLAERYTGQEGVGAPQAIAGETKTNVPGEYKDLHDAAVKSLMDGGMTENAAKEHIVRQFATPELVDKLNANSQGLFNIHKLLFGHGTWGDRTGAFEVNPNYIMQAHGDPFHVMQLADALGRATDQGEMLLVRKPTFGEHLVPGKNDTLNVNFHVPDGMTPDQYARISQALIQDKDLTGVKADGKEYPLFGGSSFIDNNGAKDFFANSYYTQDEHGTTPAEYLRDVTNHSDRIMDIFKQEGVPMKMSLERTSADVYNRERYNAQDEARKSEQATAEQAAADAETARKERNQELRRAGKPSEPKPKAERPLDKPPVLLTETLENIAREHINSALSKLAGEPGTERGGTDQVQPKGQLRPQPAGDAAPDAAAPDEEGAAAGAKGQLNPALQHAQEMADDSKPWDDERRRGVAELVGQSRQLLRKQFADFRSSLDSGWLDRMKNSDFDFPNKRLVSPDGKYAMQWVNSGGGASGGVVMVNLETGKIAQPATFAGQTLDEFIASTTPEPSAPANVTSAGAEPGEVTRPAPSVTSPTPEPPPSEAPPAAAAPPSSAAPSASEAPAPTDTPPPSDTPPEPSNTPPAAPYSGPEVKPRYTAPDYPGGLSHERVEQAARDLNINLEDKANSKETWGDVAARALGDERSTILRSLKRYDPTKNPNLTNDERLVAADRLNEIQRDLPRKQSQAVKEQMLMEASQLANALYRSGSEAGRSLQFSKALLGDDLSAARVMSVAQAALEGKLTPRARRSLLTAAGKAGEVRQMLNQRAQAAAELGAEKVKNIPDRATAGGARSKRLQDLAEKEQAIRNRTDDVLDSLGAPARKRAPRDPRVDMALWEYADGARNLNTFARRMNAKYPDLFKPGEMQEKFRQAAQAYREDYKGLDTIKTGIAGQISREIFRQKPLWAKGLHWAGEGVQLARTLQTSIDLSAPGRQGLLLTANNALTRPRELAGTFGKMIGAMANEHVADAVHTEIQSRPNAQDSAENKNDSYYKRAGLEFTDYGADANTLREEVFRSHIGEKLPIIGRGVKASERAYATFLNKLRADNFDALVGHLEQNGYKATDADLKTIGNTINAFSGRGKLPGTLGRNAELLGQMFYSPRNLASRIQVMTGEPLWNSPGASARTRGIVAKTYLHSALGMAGLYTLLYAAGGKLNRDPKSTDFGKMKFGDGTFVDPLAGLAPNLIYGERLRSGISRSATGEETDLDEGQQGHNRLELSQRFLRSKLAPIPGLAATLMNTKDGVPTDYAGMPTSMKKELLQAYAPMSLRDLYDAATTEGIQPQDALTLMSFLGLGVSSRQSQ